MWLSTFETETQEGELEVTIRHFLNTVTKDGKKATAMVILLRDKAQDIGAAFPKPAILKLYLF